MSVSTSISFASTPSNSAAKTFEMFAIFVFDTYYAHQFLKSMITGTTPRGSAIILTKMKKPEQFNSRKEWESFIWDKAIDGLAKAGSKTNVNEILNELLGEYEKKLMLRRLTAILLIKDGLSYSQIGEIL